MNAAVPVARRAGVLQEFGKLGAFLRRDLLIAWSYRSAFLSDLVALIAQAVLFYFVGLMVDPTKMPQYGGTRTSYMAFVVVGIAITSLLNVGVGRMIAVLRNEQLMGTLESLFLTPTRPTTIQLGLVLFDLVHIPIRMAAILALSVVVFGVEFRPAGLLPATAIVAVFIPFVWGLAATSAAAVLVFRRVTGLLGLGALALTVASGTYFPLDLLPGSLRWSGRFNPVAIALTGVRAALIGGVGWEHLGPQILLLAPMSAATLAAGVYTFRLALEKERRAGTLGIY